ncbi:MAG: S41 family peptidase [Planctomycetota bacterium]
MRTGAILAAALLLAPSAATAQSTLVPAPSTTPQSSPSLPTPEPITIPAEPDYGLTLPGILQRGLELETNRRWGDALTLYEQSLRQHPGSEELLARQDLARMHYSLERRYHDRSFQQSLRTLTPSQTLSLYSELLRKINAHYVVTPPWPGLASRAARAVDVALTNEDFTAFHRLAANNLAGSNLRGTLDRMVSDRRPQRSSDLVELAAQFARTAEARAGIPQTAVLMEFVTAAAGGLDDYSDFLTSDQLRDVYSQIEGNFVGLGVELKADGGALLIVHVIPGSPAERAGIIDGDRIVAVDGQSTAEMSTDEAASLLTGPEGSWVRVTAYTPGKQPRVLNVRREHVEVPSLEDPKIIDSDYGVAYVRIPAFQKTTARDLEAALWDLHRQGMRSLVLDLRGNPGGLLTAAVEVADKFLTRGNIVSTRGRSPQEDFNYKAHYGGTWRVPLVVLIDGDSASASEIFAGAIKDNGRGTIVGQTSFGKGSVQGIFPLGYAGAGIRLTTAKFYSPNGKPISKHGIQPHDQVRVVAKPIAGAQAAPASDRVLEVGVEAARRRVAAR